MEDERADEYEVIHTRGPREFFMRFELVVCLVSVGVSAWLGWGQAWIGRGAAWAMLGAWIPTWFIGTGMVIAGLVHDGRRPPKGVWLWAVLGQLVVIAGGAAVGMAVASLTAG